MTLRVVAVRYLASLAFLALMLLPSACDARPPYEQSRRVTYLLEMQEGHCSATSVARHVFLTASHCMTGDVRSVALDGEAMDVVSIIHDGYDHALVTVNHTFRRWAKVAPDWGRDGDPVYVIGNPGDFQHLFRKGEFWGRYDFPFRGPKDPEQFLAYGIEVTHGDSGAAIFDSKGRIITTLTGGVVYRDGWRMAVAFWLNFSQLEIRSGRIDPKAQKFRDKVAARMAAR